MGPGRKMDLPFRRYSVPETVMRKYWMSREKANAKNMVDKSAQTEWRPCVIWTEASSNGSVGRSASEPWLQGPVDLRGISCRPATAPSTPSWSSTTLPPATTSAPTTSTSTSLLSTDPTRSPRPPPSVQVLCFHHGVSKTDVKIQFPEPSESSTSEGTPSYVEVGVNTDYTPPPTPIPEETSHDVGVQTGSRPTTSSDDSLPNSKICQTDFGVTPPPTAAQTPTSKRVDFSCQTERVLETIKEKPDDQNGQEIETTEQINKEASCSTGNYKEYPGSEMIIPRYSAFPRTGSMVVNIPSMDNSDSDLSLTDSLEDPCEGFISEWPENKLDNRLVRGEVSQIPVTASRSFIRSKNTCAYFLFLSGEEGSIKEYKVPRKVEARLRRREEEIKKIYDLKYRKFPQITYRKKRRVQPIVLREMESQTNIKAIVNGNAETIKKKIVASKSFDSSCECNTSKKGQENMLPLKKLDRSKTISSFNINSDRVNNGEREESIENSSKSESSEEKTPRISLTLTVPSRSKKKDEENIDEKVARILIQSLEEIRSQKHSVHATISDDNKSETTELSQHFIKKAQAMTTKSVQQNSIPGPSKVNPLRSDKSSASVRWENLRPGKQEKYEDEMPVLRSCQHPNIKYEEVRSRTSMRETTGKEALQNDSPDEPPQTYLKVVKDRRQYEQTCGHSVEDSNSSRKEKNIEDEDLLRAVLKKSMQTKGASTSVSTSVSETLKRSSSHSEVCELGLKFLSNEIDIDQFIAGIPLERIEQDVKKLMYKHYLGNNPEAKESDSAYESLMKKKMVVSFVDNERKSKEESIQTQKTEPHSRRCIHCGNTLSNLSLHGQKNSKTNQFGQLNSSSDPSVGRGSNMCCHHCLLANLDIYHLSDEEPEKMEKSVSPLDKSVATAVQTMDSFLDSERLPVVNEINDSKFESILCSAKHNDNCKYSEDKNSNGCSKFCACKNNNHDSCVDPHKNMNPPNNHSPLNKSYYSPRPVKSCIKNNFEPKVGQRSEAEGGPPAGSKRMPASDVRVSKAQASKRSKNELNLANKDKMSHPKEPLEVKVIDNKGNVLTKGARNMPNKSEKKTTTKSGISKKSQMPSNKYSQMFDVIPEERGTPDYSEDFERKMNRDDVARKTRNHAPTYALSKHQMSKNHSMSTNTEPGVYVDTPKKFVSKAVETISQKSVSTMVNFEHMGRDDPRRHEMVKKEKSSKHYQPKSKVTARSDRDFYMDELKQSTDGKKGVVIGKYRPVGDKSDVEAQSVAKTKTSKPGNRRDGSEDMLSLSKGWINFYLVRDNNDLTDITDKDNNRSCNGFDEEHHTYTRRSLQKATQTLEKQVQLPNLLVSESRKCYKSSSECSNISLPEIRSSSSSGPSSPENVPRVQYFRKPPDPLPDLGNEAFVKKKKKNHFYNAGDHSNKSDSGFSREGERTTRRVEVSRSEHSISSVTSSSIVMSGSPKDGRGHDRKQKKSKTVVSAPNQSDSGSCWTVTVAGSGGTGNQPPPDVEMRLSFAGQRDEGTPRPQVLYSSHQATNLAVKSSNHHEIVEEKADSDNSLQYSSGDPVSSVNIPKRDRTGINQNSRMYYDHDDYRQLKSRKCGSEDEWECERRGGILHVTGNAITPEEKPRVPTQSERDLVRSHRYRFTR